MIACWWCCQQVRVVACVVAAEQCRVYLAQPSTCEATNRQNQAHFAKGRSESCTKNGHLVNHGGHPKMSISNSKPHSSDRPNYWERLRWLALAILIVGTLWGALSPGAFLVASQLVLTVAVAYIAGCLVGLLPRIPPLLGMMIAGVLLNNLRLVHIPTEVTAGLRSLALTVILLRAGLGLDLSVLRKLSVVCVRLTFLPCFAEAFSVMVASYFLLGFPILWGLLLGFVLAAVSPAVVVPAMIELTQRRLGTGQGIPTLVMAAASFDDVAAITGFGVMLAMIFQSADSGGSLWFSLLLGPLEAVAGLVIGTLFGVALAFILPANRDGEKQFDLLCPLYLVLGGAGAIFISNRLHAGGVGPLAAITAPAVAAVVWKRRAQHENPDDIAQIRSSSTVLKYLWIVLEPVLFSMIGLEVDLAQLQLATVASGVLTLVICLLVRIGVTLAAVSCSPLTLGERIFVCIAWLPKATVQAALAPTALDIVRSWQTQTDSGVLPDAALFYSETVLTVGVLAIIITAPLGAIGMSLLASKLLTEERDTRSSPAGEGSPTQWRRESNDAKGVDDIDIADQGV